MSTLPYDIYADRMKSIIDEISDEEKVMKALEDPNWEHNLGMEIYREEVRRIFDDILF